MTEEINLKPLEPKKYLNVTRVTVDTVGELTQWLSEQQEIGFDVETTVTKTFFDRKVRTIQFGTKDRQFIVDLLDFVQGDSERLADVQGWYGVNLYAAPLLKALLSQLEPFLCTDKVLKVGVNLGFEFVCFYWNFGMSPWHFYGCDIVERVKVAGEHSLEDFGYFSMESMMARYYGVQIDKTLQTSFTIDQPLSDDQIDYAVLDTRLPLAIKHRQIHGYDRENGTHIAGIKDEGLVRVCQLENDAIMPFEQMHVHGEKIDTVRWNKRVDGLVIEHKVAFSKLDELFIPVVGSKNDVISQDLVDEANAKWRAIKDTKDPLRAKLKANATLLSKQRTAMVSLAEAAQGNALINYGSPTKLLKCLRENFAGLQKLKSTDDEQLKLYEGNPVIDALRDYRELDKQISTYGYAWTKEWINEPSNEEGWLSPFTHKLHSRFNQLAAETGRSSSDKPNGQNLPRSKEVRQCFIAEEGLVYITCDMSGAELRILAELAHAKVWIDAFNRGEDVHSICCELLFPHEWVEDQCKGEISFKNKKTGEMVPYFCEFYKLNDKGLPQKQKCECPKHKARRDTTKTLNFGIAYGMIAITLARRANIPEEEAQLVLEAWMDRFADIWAYLEQSGRNAKKFMKAFDMFGGRRLFPMPSEEKARQKYVKYWKDSIKLPEAVAEQNVLTWMEENKELVIDKKGNTKYKYKKPTGDTKFWLTHREPNSLEIAKALRSMLNGVERQGKNHPIQGTNARIAKLAMGAGKDKNGKPFLFHIFPKYGAKLVKFVHDELVVTAPPEHADQVAFEIADAFKRAAAVVMSRVAMEAEFKIAPYWEK